jgi:hypothetical protein
MPTRTAPSTIPSGNVYGSAAYENKIILKVKEKSAQTGNYDSAFVFGDDGAYQHDPTTTAVDSQVDLQDPEDSNFDKKQAVVFHATPQVQESGTADWVEQTYVRQPASIMWYRGSPSRNFTITAKFISRTKKEANRTFRYVNLLRSWRMPEFNGAEPQVLHLFGYGQTFRGIPVVIRSLNIDYNDDVDYIKTDMKDVAGGKGDSDVPIVLPVSLTLQEIHSSNDFKGFNIEEFRKGILPWW